MYRFTLDLNIYNLIRCVGRPAMLGCVIYLNTVAGHHPVLN